MINRGSNDQSGLHWPRLRRVAAVAAALLGMAAPAAPQQGFSRVIVPPSQSPQERTLTAMLIEETQARSASGWTAKVESSPLGAAVPGERIVAIAPTSAIPALLPPALARVWRKAQADLHPSGRAEGFSVVSLPWSGAVVYVVAGNDPRGELFGVGWLLRQMSFATGAPRLPARLRLATAPEKAVRGHQIGYRNKNNTYDVWNLAQFEHQIRDLAIFGGNALQLIAPVSDDDKTSVLYPAPPLETLLGISSLLEKYGLDCDLYYPEMRPDYTQPGQVSAELTDFEALVKAMPRLDALYVPGGDPGHTPPDVLFRLLAREVEILHRYHPGATVWVSAQGFDRDRYELFYKLLDAHPAWLTGVFFGPQSRDSFATQRRRIPARYAMQFYPDIAHTMHAQFPVPQWDPIWALTEGREPICPRPAAFAAIYRHYQRLNSGFITYSEGVNDDVNKMLWNQLGWSTATPVETILGDYARWFLHREGSQRQAAANAIAGLERDWDGPIAIERNRQIARTMAAMRSLEAQSTPGQVAGNGRWESLLYRATYDDYVQRKLVRERAAEANALSRLAQSGDASERVSAARQALAATAPGEVELGEHDRLFKLADQLFHDWGLQMSVARYHAENWERGANLDRVDTPLTDAAWLNRAMEDALAQPGEALRSTALHSIAAWRHPQPGALYDDLGDPAAEPHLLRGPPWSADPEMYGDAIDSIADRTLAANPSPSGAPSSAQALPWRLSWLDYAETLYEVPLTLRYAGLDPHRSYRVRVTYAGEDYALPLRLIANGTIEVHGARLRHGNPETVEFPLPAAATSSGRLTLSWIGPEGSGGSGRGRQVAEVWLLPGDHPR